MPYHVGMKRIAVLSALVLMSLVMASMPAQAAPHVERTSPEDGDTGVLVNQPVYIWFDEIMMATKTIPAITIEPADGTVACAPTNDFFSRGCEVFQITPSPFKKATTYTVTISTAAENVSGVNLAHPYTFSFATEPNNISDAPAIASDWIKSNFILFSIVAILIVVLIVAYFKRK